jgi:hypothetical protein
MLWSEHLYDFYFTLRPPRSLPNDVEWLYPQKQPEVKAVVKHFLDKYYADDQPRTLLFGINPGRYGAGVTGVNFTAPKQLSEELQIPHAFKMQSELSAEFIYKMINAYGGADRFYHKYFLSSVCPFGFIKNGKNINYYDDKELLEKIRPFLLKAMRFLLDANVNRDHCYSLGGEKNYKFLSSMNEKYNWFNKVVPLPHPRFIMQYKRKQLENYIKLYLEKLEN